MTTIGFVRHGVTDWNKENRAQGQHDVPLNEEGIRQAERLAQRLAGEGWELIYSSDLQRAKKTAEIIAAAMGRRELDGCDARLREKSHGRLDGTTVAERVERWGANWRELDHGEESAEEIVRRSLDFLQELTKMYPDRKVLIVGHGAWIAATLDALLEGEEIVPLHNTSVCVLKKEEEGWNCLLMGCTKHLEMV